MMRSLATLCFALSSACSASDHEIGEIVSSSSITLLDPGAPVPTTCVERGRIFIEGGDQRGHVDYEAEEQFFTELSDAAHSLGANTIAPTDELSAMAAASEGRPFSGVALACPE